MHFSLRRLSLTCLLLGCAPTGRLASPGTGTPEIAGPGMRADLRPMELRVQVEAYSPTSGGARALLPEESVHRGECIALKVAVSRPAYVYAVNYSDSEQEWSQPLFPGGLQGERPLDPTFRLRIPEGITGWAVPPTGGNGIILIAASAAPIDERLASLLRLPWPPPWTRPPVNRSGDPPPVPSPRPAGDFRTNKQPSKLPASPPSGDAPPPRSKEGKTAKERGGALAQKVAAEGIVHAASDSDGLAVVRFVFKNPS